MKLNKTIHYCWFGKGAKGELFKKCLRSWKKYFPDYEIKEWNETNFDINCNEYVKEAYENKKYAFVSDFARLQIIYDNGGIYFDTDVEVIKRIDDEILENGYLAEEEPGVIATGLGFSANAKNEIIKIMLDDYKNINFIQKDNQQDLTPCPIRNTESLKKANYKIESFNNLEGIMIYPPEYFCGYDIKNNCVKITDKTYTIHHYNGSWLSKKERIKTKAKKTISRIIGKNAYEKIRIIKNKISKGE